jgi:hypothetical protein
MTCELAFAHGVAWWRGEPVVPLEVEPAPPEWTVHVVSARGGFAISVDDETKDALETLQNA